MMSNQFVVLSLRDNRHKRIKNFFFMLEKEETLTEIAGANKVEEFNWDNVGKGRDIYNSDERSRLEQMYESTLNSVAEHEVVKGTVVAITNKEVVVNIG